MIAKYKSESGFTIIELLIATAVFAIILLMTLAGFVQIGRTFYKGITISRTDSAIANIADNLAADIRASHAGPTNTSTGSSSSLSYFCIGSHIYYFHQGYVYEPGGGVNAPNDDQQYGLTRGDIQGACTDPTSAPLPANTKQLLGNEMRVSKLDVNCNPVSTNRLCNISIHIAYGDNDLLYSPSGHNPAWQGDDVLCTGVSSGTQFCATADINTSVLRGGSN